MVRDVEPTGYDTVDVHSLRKGGQKTVNNPQNEKLMWGDHFFGVCILGCTDLWNELFEHTPTA